MKIITSFFKYIFKFKFFRYFFGFVVFGFSIYFFSSLSNFFPENDILRQVPLYIIICGFIYFFYIIYKIASKEDAKKNNREKKGTNPIAWFFKPTKYEKKERARLRANARGRAKTLEKKGKGESAAAERRNHGTYKKY